MVGKLSNVKRGDLSDQRWVFIRAQRAKLVEAVEEPVAEKSESP
jgi:hypothetical protein